MKHKLRRLLVMFLSLLLLFAVGCSKDDTNNPPTNNGEPNNNGDNEQPSDSKSILDLQIGDRVVDPTWQWEFRQGYGYTVYSENEVTQPVSWIVVAKNHYQENTVVLVSEYLIGFYIFDNSVLESGLLAGQNHWGNSGQNNGQGLRPWLNSTSPQESEGFYQAFSSQFKSIVVETTLENYEHDTGVMYTTNDNVFIPSHTELGGVPEDFYSETYVMGEAYPYFVDADYTKLDAEIPNSFDYDYWTRNTYKKGYRVVGLITSGIYADWFADANNIGVRPAVSIVGTTKVSNEPNQDGYYEITY